MQLDKAMEIFREQFDRFKDELAGWTIGFSDSYSYGGKCEFKSRRLFLSWRYALLNDVEWVTDTCIHEIAHALEFVRHKTSGHTWRWKSIVTQIGGSESVTMQEDGKTVFPFRYRFSCPNCGNTVYRNRLFMLSVFCMNCKSALDKPESWNRSAVDLKTNPETGGSLKRGGYLELKITPSLQPRFIFERSQFPLLLTSSHQIISLCNSNWTYQARSVQIGLQNLYETR